MQMSIVTQNSCKVFCNNDTLYLIISRIQIANSQGCLNQHNHIQYKALQPIYELYILFV